MRLILRSRLASRACALLLCLGACRVYDDSNLSAAGRNSTPLVDACVPEPEVCNGRDDDCDGVVDERSATELDCQTRIVHANTVCQSPYCVRISCLDGYYTCDGLNENGCESHCPCNKPCADGSDAGQ